MSSILDTASIYDTYAQSVSSSNASSLQGALANVNGETEDEQLMEACKDFEEYFVQKIIEQAKTSIVGESEESQGEYMKYFGEILNQQYAKAVVDSGSTGLAQQLYESMKHNLNL